jgi:hypothetical protein
MSNVVEFRRRQKPPSEPTSLAPTDADIFPWTIDWKKARAQQHVTCVGKEAAESSELCLDGLDRQEPLSQCAQALQSALAAPQILDMAVQTLAHEKFDPQDPPEPAIRPVLQLDRSIGGRGSDFFTAEKLAPGNLGLLQQYLPIPDSCTAKKSRGNLAFHR